MKVRALKSFPHDQLGRVAKGQEFEATEAQLSGVKRFVEEVYETKVVRETPVEQTQTTEIKHKTKGKGKR